ncbi:peptidase M48-like protein [Blastomonas natatoria]|uniref:Peptidase M48-like protein n=2 Tax=Blastomonas natatoria TaxID=34015 RepID=A0A2V3URA7_9SPHN|nr:peptidase M48-like protein [Blastomonas natatoria]
MRGFARLCLALGLIAGTMSLPAVAQAGPAQPAEASLADLRASDARVLGIGYQLATANSAFCSVTENSAGLALHHIAQYPDAAAARLTFGFATDYAVLAMVPDGPAARAGLRADDAIVSLNGRPFAPSSTDLETIDQVAAYRPIAWADATLRAALNRGEVTLDVLRAGQTLQVTFAGTKACRSRFELRPSDSYGASADGDIVGITVPMLTFMADDDELAAILAHELAHNLLEHRRRLNEAGVQRGLLQQLGRNARLTLATEIEADRLSIWLMANAGFDPLGAVRFWTRYGKKRGKGIFSAPTHYRWKRRVALFEEEIATLRASVQSPRGWSPPLLAAPLQPLQ